MRDANYIHRSACILRLGASDLAEKDLYLRIKDHCMTILRTVVTLMGSPDSLSVGSNRQCGPTSLTAG